MNTILKIFLSMSFSGGLLILALLLCKQLLKDKISRQWQYYIWLVIILRLSLPFGPETNFLGKTYQTVDQVISQTILLPQQQSPLDATGSAPFTAGVLEQDNENVDRPVEDLAATQPLQEMVSLLINHIWLVVALGMLIRKVTIYQCFIQYINAGMIPVSDIEILNRLSIVTERAGIKRPIELCINPLISSPLLIGFFHPCIVLPSLDISEKDFQYIVLHEVTHYKRRDMFYKWLVQITVCLHWFNPLVHLMNHEITNACEFSCDEAVLAKMGGNNAQDYGKALLGAMVAVGRYKENLGAVTLSKNKQLLKERLGVIMRFKKQSKAAKILVAMLTLCVVLGASFVGVYSASTNIPIVDDLPAESADMSHDDAALALDNINPVPPSVTYNQDKNETTISENYMNTDGALNYEYGEEQEDLSAPVSIANTTLISVRHDDERKHTSEEWAQILAMIDEGTVLWAD